MAIYLPACVECSIMTWIRMVGVKQTENTNVLRNNCFSEKFIIIRMNRNCFSGNQMTGKKKTRFKKRKMTSVVLTGNNTTDIITPVSYTNLDVYKRQVIQVVIAY